MARLLGSFTGSVRSRTASISWKIAAFAPMPSANVNTATTAKPGDFANILIAYRKSCSKAFIAASRASRTRRAAYHLAQLSNEDSYAARPHFVPDPLQLVTVRTVRVNYFPPFEVIGRR